MKTSLLILVICLTLFSCDFSNKNKSISEVITTEINQSPELIKSIERGKDIYTDFCITCHLPNGKGVPKTFPPLANSDFLMIKRIESIKAIKYGLSGDIEVNGETYNMPMATLGLSNAEVADVMNYITNSWGNKNSLPVSEKEVSEINQ